jgi:hypothetical protein
MTEKKNPSVYHVELLDPQEGERQHTYFGSLAALNTFLTANEMPTIQKIRRTVRIKNGNTINGESPANRSFSVVDTDCFTRKTISLGQTTATHVHVEYPSRGLFVVVGIVLIAYYSNQIKF